MERIFLGCIFIFLEIIITLSGLLNWKKFMYLMPKANIWIDTFGLTFYRILISIVGISCLAVTILALVVL